MIRITQLKLPIDHEQADLQKKIKKMLRLQGDAFTYQIRRQSLDARHKDDKKFVYTVDVSVPEERKILQRNRDRNISQVTEIEYRFPKPGEQPLLHPPVIVGSGPAEIGRAHV